MEYSISLLICIAALIIAFISAIAYVKNKAKTAVILVALAIASMFYGVNYNTGSTIEAMKNSYSKVIEEMEFEISSLESIKPQVIVPEFYYVEAEIADQKQLDDGTYEIRFVANGEFYVWVDDVEYPEDVPYLLTMESNGTLDCKDDEIVVVWKDMN